MKLDKKLLTDSDTMTCLMFVITLLLAAAAVVVFFKAIGNAPIMRNNYFRITAFNRFQAVIQFLRKELNFKPTDSLVSCRLPWCCPQPTIADRRVILLYRPCTPVLVHQCLVQSSAR